MASDQTTNLPALPQQPIPPDPVKEMAIDDWWPSTREEWNFWQKLVSDEHARQAAETERLRAELADIKCSIIAFGAPAMVEYARDMGLPKGHLYPSHYDILKQAGARMDSFTRAEAETHGH